MGTTYEGYCVKCREKREFQGTVVALRNGRRAAKGTCPVCGTKVNRILGRNDPGEPVSGYVTGSVPVVGFDQPAAGGEDHEPS